MAQPFPGEESLRSNMTSLTKQKKAIERWKKTNAGKRHKRAKRRGTTPPFAVHQPKD